MKILCKYCGVRKSWFQIWQKPSNCWSHWYLFYLPKNSLLKRNMLWEAEKGQTSHCIKEQEIVAKGLTSVYTNTEGCSLTRKEMCNLFCCVRRCAFCLLWQPYLELLSWYVAAAVNIVLPPYLQWVEKGTLISAYMQCTGVHNEKYYTRLDAKRQFWWLKSCNENTAIIKKCFFECFHYYHI